MVRSQNYHRHQKEKAMDKAKDHLLQLNLDQGGEPANTGSPGPDETPSAGDAQETPSFAPVQPRPWLLTDFLRILLVLLSVVVAAGFVLIVLPQPTVDKMTQSLEARYGTAQQEKIAFLYLGDEVKDNEFHIHGVIRNITTSPIEQLDAAVRLYGHDGSLLQTTIVRMDKETIAPDEIAQFELVYPNYKMELAKYSVDFCLRNGELVSYKDMRATR
jgi:hypothetical protein